MKKYIVKFVKRGLLFSGLGPVATAIVFAILGHCGVVASVSTSQFCIAVLSSALMAFIAAGLTVIYDIDRLPLFCAVLIHGVALYLDYVLVYLLNGWLEAQWQSILVFTGIFILGYALVWLVIYLSTKKTTASLNRKLKSQ